MWCESATVPKLSAHTTGTAWTVAEHSKTSDHGSLTQIDVQLLSRFIMESNKVSPASTYQASSHNTHD